MTRTGTPEPGVEEWTCTTCARRLLLRRPPAFEKIVLKRGDERAAHVGGTGGLRVNAAKAMSEHRPSSPAVAGSRRDTAPGGRLRRLPNRRTQVRDGGGRRSVSAEPGARMGRRDRRTRS